MKALFAITAMLLAVWIPASAAGAQDLCGASLAQCDLQTDGACLARTYACGRYDTVIQTLFVEDFAPTADQKYFMGASFYGRYIRARAKGLECEMVKFGREYLTDYLSGLDLQFSESGSFGTVAQMDQLYHATRMLDDLNAVTGCVESAFTRARIQAIARGEAVDQAKLVFLDPPEAARQEFGTLVLALRGFVSRASDLETGIALRRIEIQSSETHLGAIGEIFEEIFGRVRRDGASVSVDTRVLDDLDATTRGYVRDVGREEGEFRAALGGVSAEEYAAIRSENVSNAQALLKASAFHINMIGEVLPTDTAAPFWTLVEQTRVENAAKSARDDLASIRAAWAEHGADLGICSQPQAAERIWYCR